MRISRLGKLAHWSELLVLLGAAPLLYFPDRFASWGWFLGLLLLLLVWIWRRFYLGHWLTRTAADWPLVVFCLWLPLAVYVAPPDLRFDYAYPRSLIVFWNVTFFVAVVAQCSRGASPCLLMKGGFVASGAIIALAALFGTRWDTKVPILTAQLERLPRLFEGMFAGASEGFSPNQLAGALLYVLPVAIAWLMVEVRQQRRRRAVFLSLAVAIMMLVMVAAQSRSGLMGLAASLALLLLLPTAWGRWVLGVALVCLAAAAWLLPAGRFLTGLDDITKAQGLYGSLSVAGRMEIWSRAFEALQDFPFTGVGLGSFREIVHELYPLYLIPPQYDIAHAHNFFLQTALDFGLVGLIAVLALYMLAVVQILTFWRTGSHSDRIWAIGLFSALVSQALYSMTDAVTMGSKPNVLFWWLLSIIFGATRHLAARRRVTSSFDPSTS